MTRPDGFYDATIHHIDFLEDGFNEGQYVASFALQFTDPTETATANHPFGKWRGPDPTDDYAKRFKDVLAAFGIDSIAKVGKLAECEGKTTRVRVKTNDRGQQRVYIATAKAGKSVALDEINAKFADADEPLPF